MRDIDNIRGIDTKIFNKLCKLIEYLGNWIIAAVIKTGAGTFTFYYSKYVQIFYRMVKSYRIENPTLVISEIIRKLGNAY